MLLRRLEYLVALGRERHFARAAAVCDVSQPALSAGLRRLEAELGVQVVRHGPRFDGFTPEGEVVVAWARRILADADALHQDLARMAGGLTGTLRLGAVPTALTISAQLTEPFARAHPAVRVRWESTTSREIARRVVDDDLDAGLTYVDGEPLGPGVRTVPLYRERYLLLTPIDGPLAGHERAGWAEVAALPLALLSPEMQNRRILDARFAGAGAGAEPSVETDEIATLYAHVGTHRWSTVIAHAWLPLFGVPAGMRVVPMADPADGPRIGLVLSDREPGSMLARALVAVAGEVDLS